MRLIALGMLFMVLTLGCVKGGQKYTYNNVLVEFSVENAPKDGSVKIAEYRIENRNISYTLRSWGKDDLEVRRGVITEQEYRELGRKIVEAGIYGMPDNMISKTGGLPDEGIAALRVNIDNYNKTIVIKPYDEQYVSGNIKKIVFEIKRLSQKI